MSESQDRCRCGHPWTTHDGMGDCRREDKRTATGWCERCTR